MNGIIGDILVLILVLGLIVIDDFALSVLTVLLGNFLELLNDNRLYSRFAVEDCLEVGNFLFEVLYILRTFEDILAV